MSEYQYYEFQAIDRPLDEKAMRALRAVTSRATITPSSLINEYHYGDFKGDPDRLMDKYFDALLYVANWGTHRLMLRLPKNAFPLATAEPYSTSDSFRARATSDHVVLDFESRDEGYGDYEEGEGQLAGLIPLRAELLAGDLRALYIAWLSGVVAGEVGEEEVEPPVPPGLGKLSATLTQLADFLRVDTDLIEVAAAASIGPAVSVPGAEQMAPWIAALSDDQKNQFLLRLMEGETVALTGELLRRFREEQALAAKKIARSSAVEAPRRTVGELLAAHKEQEEKSRLQAEERAAKELARREREKAEERMRHLTSLRGKEDQLWKQVETAIATKQSKQYDHAVTILEDLLRSWRIDWNRGGSCHSHPQVAGAPQRQIGLVPQAGQGGDAAVRGGVCL